MYLTYFYNQVPIIVSPSEGMKMRGSKPDSNGSQKLLSKEAGSAVGSIISALFCPLVSYIDSNLEFYVLFRMKT